MIKISTVLLLFVGACNSANMKIGQAMIVNEFCLGAIDEASYARLNEIIKQEGCQGIQELVLADKVFALEPGDTVQVVEAGPEKFRITNLNDTFWVASKYLIDQNGPVPGMELTVTNEP